MASFPPISATTRFIQIWPSRVFAASSLMLLTRAQWATESDEGCFFPDTGSASSPVGSSFMNSMNHLPLKLRSRALNVAALVSVSFSLSPMSNMSLIVKSSAESTISKSGLPDPTQEPLPSPATSTLDRNRLFNPATCLSSSESRASNPYSLCMSKTSAAATSVFICSEIRSP